MGIHPPHTIAMALLPLFSLLCAIGAIHVPNSPPSSEIPPVVRHFPTLSGEGAPFPPLGTPLSLVSSSNRSLGLRNCNGLLSVTPIGGGVNGGTQDFWLTLAAPVNGVPGNGSISLLLGTNGGNCYLSLSSTFTPAGHLGISCSPTNVDDASWQLTPGLGNASHWTLVTQSKGPLAGHVLTFNASSDVYACGYTSPDSGDAVLPLSPGG